MHSVTIQEALASLLAVVFKYCWLGFFQLRDERQVVEVDLSAVGDLLPSADLKKASSSSSRSPSSCERAAACSWTG